MAKKRKPKEEKASWIVRLKCVVYKDVVTESCTEDEARKEPFSFAASETEVEMVDYDFVRIERND